MCWHHTAVGRICWMKAKTEGEREKKQVVDQEQGVSVMCAGVSVDPGQTDSLQKSPPWAAFRVC